MVNKRDATLDVARGLAVLSMPPIHTVLIYSSGKVQQGMLGEMLALIAEWTDAPVFMLLMGVSVAITKQKTPKQVMARSMMLFALAYLLNFLKFTLPILTGMMPTKFLTENGILLNGDGLLQLSLMGDILHLAAFGYLVCGLLYRFQNYRAWALSISLSVILVAPAVWAIGLRGNHFDFIMGLFNGAPPRVFFPVFPWLAYPLIGLSIGSPLKTKRDLRFYPMMFFCGCGMITAGWYLSRSESVAWGANFYRLGPGGTICHTGAAFVWLCVCRALVPLIKRSKLFILLVWCSKNITQLYVAQWALVFWLMPVFGYNRLGLTGSCIAILVITTLTLVLTFLWKKLGQNVVWNNHGNNATIL